MEFIKYSNIGTLNQRTISSMIMTGKRANELNIPVVFDPVGVGASTLRNKTAEDILSKVEVDVIRGNLLEISFIAGYKVSTKGVDAVKTDKKYDAVEIAKIVSNKYSCVVGTTGKAE